MAGWPPKKNTGLTIMLPIFDADGDLVSSAAGLDSQVSKDGAGFNPCTNEATEIGATGMYSLALTATEMNADVVAIIVETSTEGAKSTPIVLYTDSKQVGELASEAGGNVAAILADTDELQADDVPGLIAALENLSAAAAEAAVDAALATYDGPTLTEMAAGFGGLSDPTAVEVADAVLSRPISNVEGSAVFRSLAGAVAKLVNRFGISGATATIYKTNDTDAMGTQTVTTQEGADPVVEVNTD